MLNCEILERTVDGVPAFGFRFFEDGAVVCVEEDVFTDRDRATAFCKAINQNDVAVEHLWDVLEDAIAE